MQTATRLLPEHAFGLGESPVWDDRTNHLYWVDIKAPALHRLHPATGTHDQWNWPEVISCCGLADTGEVIVGGRSGLWVFDPQTAKHELTYPIPALPDDIRTNDGKVGPDGAFWISTIQDIPDRQAIGVVLRITADGEVRTLLEGFTTPNGIEWGLDGRTFYIADTRALWIDCWDYDPQAVTLTNRRRFATYTDGEGKPDGGTFDADGAYWSAGIYAGIIHQLGPQGERLAAVHMPATMTTMPCFGGPDFRTLFVTSLTPGNSTTDADGGLYGITMDTKGRPGHRFALSKA